MNQYNAKHVHLRADQERKQKREPDNKWEFSWVQGGDNELKLPHLFYMQVFLRTSSNGSGGHIHIFSLLVIIAPEGLRMGHVEISIAKDL